MSESGALDHPFALTAKERLRGRSRVSKLFAEGQSGFVYPIRYVWTEREREREMEDDKASTNDGLASVLFNVPKRFHRRANKRNLLRRRIKEAYRLQKSLLITEGQSPLHLALIYSTKDQLDYRQIYRAVGKILNNINDERS